MEAGRRIDASPEDWVQIQQLWAIYARCSDEPDVERYSEIFTADAVWEVTSGSESVPDVRFTGIDEIKSGLGGRVLEVQEGDASVYHPTMHLMANPVIEVAGDTARGNWFLASLRLTVEGDASPFRTAGRYDVRFRRIDGVWWIEHVALEMYWTVGHGSVR